MLRLVNWHYNQCLACDLKAASEVLTKVLNAGYQLH